LNLISQRLDTICQIKPKYTTILFLPLFRDLNTAYITKGRFCQNLPPSDHDSHGHTGGWTSPSSSMRRSLYSRTAQALHADAACGDHLARSLGHRVTLLPKPLRPAGELIRASSTTKDLKKLLLTVNTYSYLVHNINSPVIISHDLRVYV
jgi:hypothetical protein